MGTLACGTSNLVAQSDYHLAGNNEPFLVTSTGSTVQRGKGDANNENVSFRFRGKRDVGNLLRPMLDHMKR